MKDEKSKMTEWTSKIHMHESIKSKWLNINWFKIPINPNCTCNYQNDSISIKWKCVNQNESMSNMCESEWGSINQSEIEKMSKSKWELMNQMRMNKSKMSEEISQIIV